MTNVEIAKALNHIAPNAEWVLDGVDYSNIVWLSAGTAPTLKEIEDTIANLAVLESEKKTELLAQKIAICEKLNLTIEEVEALIK